MFCFVFQNNFRYETHMIYKELATHIFSFLPDRFVCAVTAGPNTILNASKLDSKSVDNKA